MALRWFWFLRFLRLFFAQPLDLLFIFCIIQHFRDLLIQLGEKPGDRFILAAASVSQRRSFSGGDIHEDGILQRLFA